MHTVFLSLSFFFYLTEPRADLVRVKVSLSCSGRERESLNGKKASRSPDARRTETMSPERADWGTL